MISTLNRNSFIAVPEGLSVKIPYPECE
jgi:hypothetical protein